MKILHIGKYYPPFFGGTEKVNYDIVEGLNNLGYPADVLCFNHQKNTIDDTHNNYKIYRCKTLLKPFSTPISFEIFLLLRKIQSQYDIIHLHLPNPIAGLALQFSGYKGKLILHWHCDIVKQKLVKIFYNPLQSYILKKADKIIATSSNYLNSSKDLQPYLDKCVVIPIGIDHSSFIENINFRNQLATQTSNKKIVFSLGRLIYYKGFEFLIKSARYLPEDTIVYIGGVGHLENKLKKLINNLKLNQKVFLLGEIPFTQLSEYYRRADVFCLPSCERTEAFGVVLLEAMMFGCPIVCCNIEGSGVSWVAKNMLNALVVPPKNEQQLSEALNELLGDEALRVLLSQGSTSRFYEYFQAPTMVESVINLYKSI
jgi:rhamnosyl/mannosyltransferase